MRVFPDNQVWLVTCYVSGACTVEWRMTARPTDEHSIRRVDRTAKIVEVIATNALTAMRIATQLLAEHYQRTHGGPTRRLLQQQAGA